MKKSLNLIVRENWLIFLFIPSACMTSLFAVTFNSSNEMLGYVRRFLPRNPVIVEAGGRDGEDTYRMKRVWPASIMHVFEPWKPSLEKLKKRTQGLYGVNYYDYALSTYSGTTDFYINPGNDGACSIGAPVDFNESEFNKEPIKVPCTTFNLWAKAHGVERVDFMWLDMEGHELHALQHATDFLPSVKAIYTEIDFIPTRKGAGLYADLRKFLEFHGFVEVWKSCSSGRFGDALFVKKYLVQR